MVAVATCVSNIHATAAAAATVFLFERLMRGKHVTQKRLCLYLGSRPYRNIFQRRLILTGSL